ncbi:unnamed protein product [Paramecium sonneborni]|uniref:Transmembrane protein n=1 Tax=Paramecium sonneborni TaxID=65129 RepID=A0A8S1LDR8_9CILI|nr:unnamed protein product [Paramecium sonneborni]
MFNLSLILLITIQLKRIESQITQSCQFFSNNPKGCIQKTIGNSCNYRLFEGVCIIEKNTNLGCIGTLNQEACISQETNQQGREVQCAFNMKCQPVLSSQLASKGCFQYYNKYACMNVRNANCYWENNQCQLLVEIRDTANTCEEAYQTSVTHLTCSKLSNLFCMSSGFEGQYKCVSVQEKQLKVLKCSQLGLTKNACLSIQTEGQKCIFENQICRDVIEQEIMNCNMNLNREACLSIKNSKITCQWIKESCQSFEELNWIQNNEILEVNINVCQTIQGLYRYDKENRKCIKIQEFEEFNCNTLGLSREGCLLIKDQNCSFYQGYCKVLNEQDLETYQCNMELNEMACVNLKTHFQYCKWNGNSCEGMFMNQDINCPLNLEDESIKVNGNVCKAISSSDVVCKYNSKTNLCIASSINDSCNTPYLNKKGCLSIANNKQACQWSDIGCIEFFTSCESLGYANAYACSQVYENNKIGCYYDKIMEKCIPLQIKVEQNSSEEQLNKQRLDLQLLDILSCQNDQLGLNRVACGSITKNGVACMWSQNKCQYIERKASISSIPCLHLQFANAKACSYAEYQKEVCRYNEDSTSCVTTAKNGMECREIGLNRYGCMIAVGFCYFNEELSQCLNDDSSSITEQLTCDKNSPSQPMCLSITKKGENCKWQQSSGKCSKVNIPYNSNCLSFNSQGVQVNSNTCTQIEMSFPDYDILKGKQHSENYGYCSYNQNLNICQIKTDYCTTKCCTEDKAIGINAHSCSRYSSQEPDVYCYFEDGICKELLHDVVNISDQMAVWTYYNYKQFRCSQMNRNSCHMIDWSTSQRCAHFGTSCININLQEFSTLTFLTQEPTRTNKNTCFAIEAFSKEEKYFTFDEENLRCKSLKLTSDTPFTNCEDAIGNRNVCLRYTGNNYCKWNPEKLKCETILNYQIDDIQNCESYLNIKACIENKTNSCFFSYESDKCQNAPIEVECDFFNNLGMISEKVCKLISKSGQMCQFKNYQCVRFEIYQSKCDVSGANAISCYNNMNGNCRWDSNTLQCYENFADINELYCSSNLNKVLCLKVVNEPCFWNDNDIQCQKFNFITNVEFLKLNSNNLYTKDACSLITGIGYIYQSDKCVELPDKQNTNDCQKYWMNEYACLYLTRGFKCYYDPLERFQRMKCKPFSGDYSKCYDQNLSILINIEVCMDIPQACVFEQSSLRCVPFEVSPQEKCSNLAKSIDEKKFHNKIVCSSINPDLTDNFGNQQCFQDQKSFQKCLYEKYCFWNKLFYSCSIYVNLITAFDTNHWIKKELKVCTNQNSEFETFDQGCSYQIRENDGLKFIGKQQIAIPQECKNTISNSTTCQSNENCEPFQKSYLLLDYINGNMTLTFPNNVTQTCEKRCGFQGQQTNFCNQDSDCGTEFITINNLVNAFLQKCRVMKRRWKIVYTYKYTIKDEVNDNDTYTEIVSKIDGKNITQYNVSEIASSEIQYEPVKEEDCEEDDKGCYCKYTKEFCKYDNDCTKQVDQRWIYKKKCIPQDFYQKQPYCLQKILEIEQCDNIYSKALCLEMVKQRCYFDIQQGGCRQLQGNEDKLPDCSSISMESCLLSKTKKIACSKGEKSTKPGDTCYSIIKEYNDCKEMQFYNSYYVCQKVKKEDAQNSLCARATDECRFSGSLCVNEPLINQDGTCKCDSSYSKTLCEKCGCDFTLLGYCQQSRQSLQVRQDNSNKYYLCYEVNLLDLKDIKQKYQACASIPQACKFTDQCEDATHDTCDDLLGMMVVSLKACQKCLDQPAKYDPIRYYCLSLNDDTIVTTCQNLNKSSCLKNPNSFKCKWEQSDCIQIDTLKTTDKVDCSILNQNACYLKQVNVCWFDPEFRMCTEFNPFKARCEFIKDQQTLCNLSMHENCIWQNQQCIKQDKIPPNICVGLNKYACLNQKDIPCGWSSQQVCVELQNILNFGNFIQSAQTNSILQFNSQTCAMITESKNYLLDKQFQCKEVSVIDFIDCNTLGINQQACIQKSIGKCKYQNNSCQIALETDFGCQSYLNKEACLNQKEKCQFIQKCELFQNPTLSLLETINYSYSDYVCLIVDLENKQTTSLIYLKSKGQCINISDQEPSILNCYLRGINRNACLQKTAVLCEYKDNQCQALTKSSQSPCSDTLNWLSCTLNEPLCKFENFNCKELQTTDNCESLELSQAIVNEKVCVKTDDVPCKYDSKTRRCSKVTSRDQKCSIVGLNRKSCIFFTDGSECKFDSNYCIPFYKQAKCTDSINKDKCLNLRDRTQNCQFDSTYGCLQIKTDPKICLKDFQTNPSTCSQATDIPCYYNLDTKKCENFINPSKFESVSASLDWSNRVSFNILTCQMYDVDERKTFWDDGCQEATQKYLITLQCNQFLNYYSCVNLQTPLQYCQFINNQCYEKDWYSFKDEECETISNINNANFCQITTNVECKYDLLTKNCKRVQSNENIQCEDGYSQLYGYNKKACDLSKLCIFIDKCLQFDHNNLYYCSQADQVDQCKNIILEGCYLNSSQKCSIITTELSQNLQCFQVQNKVGCIQLQTQEQNCRYYDDKCNNENIEEYKYKKCLEITQINNYKFCEQTQDIPCVFDPTINSCIQANQVSQDLTCQRGLNRKACIPLNSTSNYQCQFFKYCYGNNSEILNCPSNESECCQKAVTKESCLFQTKFKCQWNNNSCIQYREQYSVCNSIFNASRNVCYSLLDKFCIFDEINHKCKEIVPEYCDQVQNPQQCSRIPIIPCYWNEDECQFKEKNKADSCSSITNTFGNQQACIQVEKNGQMCAFIDQQCQTFKEIKDGDNCLNNINRNACLIQRQSECYWDEDVSKDTNIQYCRAFEKQESQRCEKNLSFKSCLNITTAKTYCQWRNEQCEAIDITNNDKIMINSFSYLNPNSCSLIRNKKAIMYDKKSNRCLEVKDVNDLSCNPRQLGMNIYACLQVKNELCSWEQETQSCQEIERKKLKNKEIQDSSISCIREGRSAKSCSLLNIQMGCGGGTYGCEQVDLNKVGCDHIGLNKYGCLNISSQSCKWVEGQDGEIDHCEEHYPFGFCSEQPEQVNAVLCSLVDNNDSCVYNRELNKCEQARKDYDNVIGINGYGCAQIENCIFLKGKCIRYKQELNLRCEHAEIANYKVCSQIVQNECKYSELKNGCISPSDNDSCQELGMNSLGCNNRSPFCSWENESCQCVRLLENKKDCSDIFDHTECENKNQCYYDVINSSNLISKDLIKQQNLGICKQKQCSQRDNKNCEGQIVYDIICYLDKEGKCQTAKDCSDIFNSVSECSKYSIKDRICVEKDNISNVSENKNQNRQCETQKKCNQMDSITCQKNSKDCIQVNNQCIDKLCSDYKQQTTCNIMNCYWSKSNKKCIEQPNCELHQSHADCQDAFYQNQKCGWFKQKENNICTLGCRYLPQYFINCQGTQINQYVCVKSKGVCTQCEEITDACQCLDQQDFCFYDMHKNICSSKNCQRYDQKTCPNSRCFFYSSTNTCFPQCRFRYNSQECKLFDNCLWDSETNSCLDKIESLLEEQIPDDFILEDLRPEEFLILIGVKLIIAVSIISLILL